MDSIRINDSGGIETILDAESDSAHADSRLGEHLVRSLALFEELRPELFKITPRLAIQIEHHIEKLRGLM